MIYLTHCCCCCIGLRTGGKIIGFICILYALTFLVYVIERIVEIVIEKPKPIDYLDQSALLLDGFFYMKAAPDKQRIPIGLYIDGVIFIVQIFCAILLIIGAHRRRNRLIIPWLVNAVLFLIVRISVQTLKIYGSLELLTDNQLYGLIANEIITDLVYIYIWYCILSLYQENKISRRYR